MAVNDLRQVVLTDEKELFTVKPGANDTSATFIFGNEDHTLGNALRYVLMRREETEFCGYSVPHPYEPKMNVRLQTTGEPAVDVLKKGLQNLEEAANIMDDTFAAALNDFRRKKR
jgi:DNA-directed RNA polymerase I and III subunit RPAC2